MALAPGTRLGSYQIVAPIGAGGMGEVYRARDTRLNRDVAIKILPAVFADDPERLARFEREAQVLASLNHPNIAQIYGIEEGTAESPAGASANAGAVVNHKALVMELVEGEDLAVHIGRHGAVPLHECLTIARQIADALECAHELGIVHRDLKPANVKVREDGTVKVLDFGLAKLADPTPGSSSSSPMLSPTITSPATQLGVILGTAAYMSPEQARGKAVDKRADVWAFGLVLYEMLTGKRAFEGSEISDTLAFILTKDPDWSALPAATPPPIHRLLRRCLQKDRKQRLADMSDARLELNEALAPVEPERPAIALPLHRSRWFLPAAAAFITAMVLGGTAALWLFRTPPQPGRVVRFSLPLDEGVEFTNTGRQVLAISQDGGRIVFVANLQLYLRTVESMTAQPIAGSGSTGPVVGPVFSPDGQSIAYYSDGALRRIAVVGGTPVTLAPMANPFGTHWTAGNLLVGQGRDGVVRIPEAGGKPETIAKLAGGEWAQGPQMLPGDEWIIFTLASGSSEQRWEKARIVAQSLRSGERKVLIEGAGDARYVATGHLLYSVSGVVFAVAFDPTTVSIKGAPRPVIEGVRRSEATGASHYALAANGTLIYLPGPASVSPAERRLGFLDRSGVTSVMRLPPGGYQTPRLSPDGRRVAVANVSESESNIWIYDLSGTSVIRRLTFGGKNRFPVWSPDGRQVVFQSDREGDAGLYVQDADVSGGATRLTKADKDRPHMPTSWSRDGQWLALGIAGVAGANASIQILSIKDKTVKPFHTASGGEPFRAAGGGAFSPDGRWLAYAGAIAPGDAQVYVEPFPPTGAKYQIGPGINPAWSHDGAQLFIDPIRAGGFTIFRVMTEPRFSFSEGGQIRREGIWLGSPGTGRNYDVMPDGKRLLVLLRGTAVEFEPRAMHVALNWFEELKKR